MEQRVTVSEMIAILRQFDGDCLVRIKVNGEELLNPIIDMDTTAEDDNGKYPVVIE